MSVDARERLKLSVVVVTPDRFANIRRTVRHLRMQAARERIELIIVAASRDSLADCSAEELSGFGSVQEVFAGPISNVDKASAHGIHAATAPAVAIIEDHAYPQPGWAEAIIRAHEGPWGVVGSIMLNANPHRLLSWTNLLIAYGRWTEPTHTGPAEALPGHNISFKRDLLQNYGNALPDKLGRDGNLLEDLLSRGVAFYLEPQAKLAHVNPSRVWPTVDLRFNAGRLYGTMRAQQARWGLVRRLVYFCGGPLIPLVRFVRLRRDYFGAGQRKHLLPRFYPALLFGLVLDGLGQMAGYALGAGPSVRRLAVFEMDRLRQITAAERRALAEQPPVAPGPARSPAMAGETR